MMTHTDLTPGYILHTRPYRDSSLLAEVFSRNHGRVGAIFKGAKNPVGGKKRPSKAANFSPFIPRLLSWYGKGELKSGRGIELAGTPVYLTGARLFSGLYLNELLVRLLHRDDPVPVLYDLYQDTLLALQAQASPEIPLRTFEKGLLLALGYGLDFSADAVDGSPIQPRVLYCYDPSSGFSPAPTGQEQAPGFQGQLLLNMGRDDYRDAATRKAAKRLMRQALAPHLGDRPLESRKLFITSDH